MDSLDDIKNIWQSAKVSMPPTEDIGNIIKRYKLRKMLKTVGLLLLTLLIFATMLWVLFAYHSKLITTRIGEASLLLAMLIMLRANIGALKRISVSKPRTNRDFLQYLKEEKLSIINFQKRTQKIGFAFACTGLLLYIYEVVHTDTSIMIISYLAVIGWCCFSWFVIRPLATKRKTKKLNTEIEKLENISAQFQNP
jgi:hypothetical protein